MAVLVPEGMAILWPLLQIRHCICEKYNNAVKCTNKINLLKMEYLLYVNCDDRLALEKALIGSYKFIDGAGTNQIAFRDGDLNTFGNNVMKVATENNIVIRRILRIPDPGLGLVLLKEDIVKGIADGTIQEFVLNLP